jgi:hypothetical protein
MESKYKPIIWAVAAGAAIMGAACLVNYLWKRKKPKINLQALQHDIAKIGQIQLVESDTIEKRQMARLVAIGKFHAASYDTPQREQLHRERLAHLSTRNAKAYLQAAINSLNFEFECTQVLCHKIAKLLEVSAKELAFSQAYYMTNKDAEYLEAGQAMTVELAQSQKLPKVVLDKTAELWQEYQDLSKEFSAEPDLELSTDTKMKLVNPDVGECKAALLELKVCDELYLRHKIAQEYIQQLVQFQQLKPREAKIDAL